MKEKNPNILLSTIFTSGKTFDMYSLLTEYPTNDFIKRILLQPGNFEFGANALIRKSGVNSQKQFMSLKLGQNRKFNLMLWSVY